MRETTNHKSDTILEMQNVVKKFPGVIALNGVNFSCRRGEVHALMGENGAGKSTLIKLLSGASFPTEGKVIFNGEEWTAKTPKEAMDRGISIIYQELNLVGELNAVENIFLGREEMNGVLENYREMRRQTLEIFERMKIKINVDVPCNELTVAQQQMVEIGRALSRDAKLIVMDEPTATLTTHETNNLFEIIRELKAKDVTIIFISHHMEETYEICDRVTILKDGQYMGTHDVDKITNDEIIRLMVGREMTELFPPQVVPPQEEVLLEVKNLSNINVKDISFQVHKGEILCLAGLVGAGRSETVRAIFGADPKDSGEIYMHGRQVTISKPRDAIRSGIAFVTEDRKTEGLILDFSLSYNIMLPNLNLIQKGAFLDHSEEDLIAQKYKEQLRIKTPDM